MPCRPPLSLVTAAVGAAVLSACASASRTATPAAQIRFVGGDYAQLNVARRCDAWTMRSVGDAPVAVPAGAELWVGEVADRRGRRGGGGFCAAVPLRFTPDAGAIYELRYERAGSRCSVSLYRRDAGGGAGPPTPAAAPPVACPDS